MAIKTRRQTPPGEPAYQRVRKVLPKGTPFDNLTREQMERIDHMLNDRPMKCLNWRTPREAFERLVKQALEAEVA